MPALLADWVRGNRALAAGIALLGAVAWGLDRRLPYLNGPPEWRWIYGNNTFFFWPTWLKALPAVLAGLLASGGICLWAGRRAAGLAGLVAFGFYLHFIGYTLATPGGINHWGRIIVDPETTSYYTVAEYIRGGRLPGLRETLARYPELLRDLPKHASTHPPGAVVVCAAVQRAAAAWPGAVDGLGRFYEWLGMDSTDYRFPTARADAVAATTLGILLVLGGLLGAVPLWGLVREARIGRDGPGAAEAEAVAWAAAALWVSYPALMIFEPQFDQLYPTIVLGCLWAAQRGLRGRGGAWGAAWWGVAAGALFMLGICFSFVLLFVAPMLLGMAGLEAMRNEDGRSQKRRIGLVVGGAVGACAAAEAILRWGCGVRLLENFLAAAALQREVHLPGVGRHYHVWLFYNLYDFLFFAGTPLAVLAMAWLVRVERAGRKWRVLAPPAWVVFPLTALALDATGLTPGETSRIWLFLAPGVVWAGAAELVRGAGAGWRTSLGVLLAAQTMFYFLCRAKLTFIGW